MIAAVVVVFDEGLTLRRQEPLLLQPRDDVRPRRRRADPLRLAQPVSLMELGLQIRLDECVPD